MIHTQTHKHKHSINTHIHHIQPLKYIHIHTTHKIQTQKLFKHSQNHNKENIHNTENRQCINTHKYTQGWLLDKLSSEGSEHFDQLIWS